MKSNYGISPIFIILAIVFSSLIFFGFYYFSSSIQLSKDNFSSYKASKKYDSFAFLKFELPPLNQRYISDFFRNSENFKCYKFEYFNKVKFDGWSISLYDFNNEEPLCIGDLETYKTITFRYIESNFSRDYKDPESFIWVKDSNLSNDKFDIFKNEVDFKSEYREYFLIQNKESTRDDGILIGINPSSTEDSLEYKYILDLIKTFELREITEFKGLSNCRPNECINTEIFADFENTGYKDNGYVVRNYKITLKDKENANTYFKFVNPFRTLDTESYINSISKYKDSIIVDYEIADIKDLNNVKKISKIGILDLKNGDLKDMVVNPEGVRIQDYLVNEDEVYFITGNSCGEICQEPNLKKYLYKFDFKSNSITKLSDKSLGELGATDFEETKFFELLKFNDNKILFKVGQVLQPAFDYAEFDVQNSKITKITNNFEIFGDISLEKEGQFGVKKTDSLILKNSQLEEIQRSY